MTDKLQLNLSAALASAGVALVLVLAKLWALGETGSLSIAASLGDSAMDLMVSLGGLAAITYAARPPDQDHAFGHSSAEDLAALGQAIFIFITGLVIAGSALLRLSQDKPPPLMAEGRGMVVMALSVALTIGLVLWQRRVARLTGNRVIRADSLHYIGDLVPNTATLLALFASARWDMGQVDSVVALGAAGVLGAGALRIGKGAWDALMDRAAPDAMVARIEQIAGSWPGVYGFHDLKTRTSGSRLFINLHIEVDGEQSLHQAHDIGAGLRRAILHTFPEADVIIHKDPVGNEPHPDDPSKTARP
jgi:ferrous-iron efflux pump FieF